MLKVSTLSPPITKEHNRDTLGLVFSYLSFPDLQQCMQVSKEWREIALQPSVWKGRHNELSFTPSQYQSLCEELLSIHSHVYFVFLAAIEVEDRSMPNP